MYYLIKHTYTGQCALNPDADYCVISRKPATTNESHEVRHMGWCGTTKDWSVYAHGEYGSVDAARGAAKQFFGHIRDILQDNEIVAGDDDVVEAFRLGEFRPLNTEATYNFVYPCLLEAISGSTTDAAIIAFAGNQEYVANVGFGVTLDRDEIISSAEARREEISNDRKKRQAISASAYARSARH